MLLAHVSGAAELTLGAGDQPRARRTVVGHSLSGERVLDECDLLGGREMVVAAAGRFLDYLDPCGGVCFVEDVTFD